MRNLLELIRKIKNNINNFLRENKKIIIDIINYFIILWIFILFGSMFITSFENSLKIFLWQSILFLMISILYFVYYSNRKKRNILITIWTIYFTIVSIMFILINTMEKRYEDLKIDYYKTKISYEIQLNRKDINKTILEYETYIKSKEKSFIKKDTNSSTSIEENDGTKKKGKYIWHAYFAIGIINIATAFMFIWIIIELIPNKKKKKINKE